MTRPDRPSDHLRRFGDVEPTRRFSHGPERGVGEPAVVVESSVVRIGHTQQFHAAQSAIAWSTGSAVSRDASTTLRTS